MALLGAGPATASAADVSGASVTTPATFKAQGTPVKRVTSAVRMTRDPAPARAFSGPTSMLVDPANPRIIVAATAELRTRVCYLTRSEDAGRTWRILPAVPALGSYPYCTSGQAGTAQASLAWGRDSTLYYALEGYGSTAGSSGMGAGKEHVSIQVARSTDLGDTWNATLVDANRAKSGPDAPSDSGVTGLAVDTSGAKDVVYVGFQQSFPGAPKTSPLQDGTLDVATSTDGGVSFGPPVNLNRFNHVTQTIGGVAYPLLMHDFFGSPFLTVHDGVLLAVSGTGTPSSVKIPGPKGVFFPMPQLVARSTDQGRTWSVQALSPPIYTGTGSQTGLGWTPLGGPQGTFVAVYAATPQTSSTSGYANMVLQRSTDNGLTWSDPVVLNDDNPALRFTSFYPQLSVAPNGRVDVVFEDSRNQVDYHFGLYYTYSTDGGLTWAHNVAVSDQPINFGLGISFNSDIRQPPGVASTNQYAVFGWADTRLGNATNQNQDDFSSLAQFAPLPPPGSVVLPILASIFGGLAAAGLILIIVLGARRSRDASNGTRKLDQRQGVTVE